ncbi:MAG: hypothetical protein AAFX39_04245 [Pseudomonadota bacterium]
MTRVIFHTGTAKTGTTAIQAELAANRAGLSERGILYPETWKSFRHRADIQSANAQHAMTQAIARDSLKVQAALKRFKTYLSEASNGHNTILFSAESAYRLLKADGIRGQTDRRRRRKIYIAELSTFLQSFGALEYVVYFRRPESYATSLYTEAVCANGFDKDFQRLLSNSKLQFNYAFQVSLLRSHAPTRVHVYETAAKQGLIQHFFDDNGLGDPFVTKTPPLRVSVSNGATMWICRSNREQSGDNKQRKRRWLFANQAEHADLFGTAKTSFWRSKSERDAFVEACRPKIPEELALPEPEEDVAPFCDWTDQQHHRTEETFRAWQEDQKDRIDARERARLAPFMPDPS